MPADQNQASHRAAEMAARRSYGKLVAFIAQRTRDVTSSEDALADAFAAALAEWPRSGIPANPEAWLIAVARRKATDAARRRRHAADAIPHLQLLSEEAASGSDAPDIPDHRLALIFACAHPAVDPGIRAPLILQTVLGFDAATIASGFLVAPATMSQRLVRAKTKIREAGIPFRVPERQQLGERLEPGLAAIYVAFAEGWSDPVGTEARRRDLAEEAIWLGRLVAELLPEEPEALGLLALMLFAEARRAGRRGPEGEYVPLAQQNPALWEGRLIDEAETTLLRASHMGSVGRYQLEAAVQSAHVVRRRSGVADWAAIERLYDALLAMTGSPVVAINRAVAATEVRGAATGLAMLDAVAADPRLRSYQPYWAARAELLARSGDIGGAQKAYQLAIGLEADPAVRRYLQERQEALRG